ncbi:MAG: SH3 domain-containing protein [Candidatus Eisenbacteria bacterium]|nr:SH3 domain-containing protein [Candidatus Eisenbacteria bacterium]
MESRRQLSILVAFSLVAQGLIPPAVAAQAEADLLGSHQVTASSLNIRSGPSTGDAVLISAPKGTVVTVLEIRRGWARVRLPDETVGWCAARYLEKLAPAEPAEPPPVTFRPATPERTEDSKEETKAGGGGSVVGSTLKWGSLVGAAVLGGLAYSEYSKGNDAYDEYKDLFHDGDYKAADAKFAETEDFDSTARTYAIAGGALFGLFVLQQFVLGGGGDEDASADGSAAVRPSIHLDPSRGDVHVAILRAAW